MSDLRQSCGVRRLGRVGLTCDLRQQRTYIHLVLSWGGATRQHGWRRTRCGLAGCCQVLGLVDLACGCGRKQAQVGLAERSLLNAVGLTERSLQLCWSCVVN